MISKPTLMTAISKPGNCLPVSGMAGLSIIDLNMSNYMYGRSNNMMQICVIRTPNIRRLIFVLFVDTMFMVAYFRFV